MGDEEVACIIQEEFDLEVDVTYEVMPKVTEQGGAKMDLLTRNIRVTELNKSIIPKEALLNRFDKIKRLLHKGNRVDELELQKEADIISSQLEALGIELTTLADQDELDLPKTVREQYVPLVEWNLEEYRNMRKRRDDLKKDLLNYREYSDTPRITASYGNIAGVTARGGFFSSTEDAVFKPFLREARMQEELESLENEMYTMESILGQLSEDQREIIEARYMVRNKPTDEYLIASLGMHRKKYYRIKGAALYKIAEKLHII